jgi:hypothetical protein
MNKMEEFKKPQFEINKFGERQYLFDFFDQKAWKNKERESLKRTIMQFFERRRVRAYNLT